MSPHCYFTIILIVTLSRVNDVKSVNKTAFRDRILQDYDLFAEPPKTNDSYLGFFLQFSTLTDVVEKQGHIVCGIGFAQIWKDERLVWNYTIEKVDRLWIKKESVWLPNPLFLYNRIENEAPLLEFPILVVSGGAVIWLKGTELSAVCTFDLSQFPFDRQTCHLLFGSRINDYGYMEKRNYVSLHDQRSTSRWRVLKAEATNRRQKHFDEEIQMTDVTVTIERTTSLVSTSIICPLIFNVIVSLLPFWITSSVRLCLGGASFYLGTAIFWKLEELLPLDGHTKPFLAHYCVLSLTITLLSLVYGVLSCTLKKRAPVAFLMSFVSKVTRPFPAVFCLPSTTAGKEMPTEERGLASFPCPENGAISWSDTLMIIDKLAFAICSLVYFLATVTLLVTLSRTE